MAVYIQAATNPTFDEYIAQYGKKYSTSEYTTRKNIYDTKVAALVAQGTLYNMTAAVNNYTDWNDNELSLLRGYKTKSSVSGTTPYLNYSNLPSALDWRSKNGVSSVKYQAQCGADWAMAVTAYA